MRLLKTLISALALATGSLSASNTTNIHPAEGKYTKKKYFGELNTTKKSKSYENKYFAIGINPFVLIDYSAATQESNKKSWQEEGLKEISNQIKLKYKIKETSSNQNPPFIYIKASSKVAQQIIHENYVSSIEEIDNKNFSFIEENTSTFINYTNKFSTPEQTPWFVNYSLGYRNQSKSSPVYIIDGNFGDFDGKQDEVNVISHIDTPADDQNLGKPHSLHVAGIIGAKQNNKNIVGISPGHPIRSFGVHAITTDGPPPTWLPLEGNKPIEGSVINAIEKAFQFAEENNEFSTLNISINYRGNTQNNPLIFNKHIGLKFRAASNRFLIVQSAGNYRIDQGSQMANACNRAYNRQNSFQYNDGIMVIGGIDQNGARTIDNNNSSAWGSCVEAWAPGKEIPSLGTWQNPSTGESTNIATGTSFAAPIVAALAAAYGSKDTRPVLREQYIHNILIPTGHTDPTGIFIKHPYTQQGKSPKSYRIGAKAIYNPSTPNPQWLNYLTDKKFTSSPPWTASANSGSVFFDLGGNHKVTGVRITLRSSASPQIESPIDFAIYGGSVVNGHYSWDSPVYYTESYQADMAPIFIPLDLNSTRYIRLDANNHASWLSYAEVEFYGHSTSFDL